MAAPSTEIQARGIVVILQGSAWVEDSNGNRRPLKVGDELEEGQKVITSEGTRLELALPNGQPLVVEAGRELILDTSLLGTAPQDKTQAALQSLNGGASDITKAIASGGDLSEQLDATAAGLGGGQGGEAHSFVRLTRISENLSDLSLQRNETEHLQDLPQNTGAEVGTAPSVLSVSNPITAEGGTLLFVVQLSTSTHGDSEYLFTWPVSSLTTASSTDYGMPTFSNGVTFNATTGKLNDKATVFL